MNDKEFENLIRQSLRTDATPSREGLSGLIWKLGTETVTKNQSIRYTVCKTSSNIINTFVHSLRSARLVLVPSLILVLIVGSFSLHIGNANSSTRIIEQLAHENEATIEEPGIDLDDGLLTTFDTRALNELTTNRNETIF